MNYTLYTIEDFLIDESFLNYCLNENPQDVLFWENIRVTNPELQVKMEQARKLLFLLSLKVDPAIKQNELLKLQSFIEKAGAVDEVIQVVPRRSIRFKISTAWFSAAAAVLIAVSSYLIFSKKDYSTWVPVYQEANSYASVKTGFNERKTYTLPDGSIVLMNAGTVLKIDHHYNENNRVLWLKGEAFFKVAKNKVKPFIVISGKTATTALGTSFKINNYNTDAQTSVMLSTGKVNVGIVTGDKVTNCLQLLPGQRADVTGKEGKFMKSTFNLQEIENWANRNLVFSMASLNEINTLLNQIYGVKILTVGTPKNKIAFTGEFHNESLSQVLTAIGFANHFSYKIKGQTVEIIF